MSWEIQGRQEHGWFGHGMGPGGVADIGSLADRIAWTAHASLMGLPRQDWRNSAAAFDGERVQRLQTAMAAWIGARSLSRAEFEKRFVGPVVSDAAIDSLRASAEAVRTATTHHDLGVASTYLASAMQGVGLGRWPGFLRDAADKADTAPPAGGEVYAQLATNTASDASPGGAVAATSSSSAYVAENPEQWLGRPSVGTGECVPLVQQATGAPHTSAWRQGALVQGDTALAPDTAIATFDAAGRYANHSEGNHAAIYLGQDASGIRVIDQWNNRRGGRITSQHSPQEQTIHFNNPRGNIVNRGEECYVVQ